MAYRKLRHEDQVRIRGRGVEHSGRNAVVIGKLVFLDVDSDDNLTRVQLVPWGSSPDEKTICVTVHNDNLMVRHEPDGWIIDGRIDHDKKAAFEKRWLENQDSLDQWEDNDCEFDVYDRDELIYMIVKLRNDISTLTNS